MNAKKLYENFLLNLQIVKISDKHKKFSQEENDEKMKMKMET